MKLNKFFYTIITFAAAATLASCEQEVAKLDVSVDLNTNTGVTVSFDKDNLSFKESQGIVSIPISASGEMNGSAKVVIEVSATGDSPAAETTNYIITSKTIYVGAESKTANVELALVDNDEINETRQFVINMKSVEGATTGAIASCTVNIRDNDSAFYEKLQGKWTANVGGDTYPVTIYGATDEDDPEYNKILYIVGLEGYDWTTLEVHYSFDMATKTGQLEIPFGTVFAEGLNFGFGGLNDVYIAGGVGNSLTMRGSVFGTWSDDFKTITFDTSTYSILLGIFGEDGSFTGYIWDEFTELTLTK